MAQNVSFDATHERERKQIRAAFRNCYQFVVESLNGQLKDLLLPQFANVKLINSNELALLNKLSGTKQVSTFLDLIVVRDGFLGPFLQVLDDNSQTSVANVVRKAMGLKPKQTDIHGVEEGGRGRVDPNKGDSGRAQMPKISHVASTVRQGGETVWSNIGRFAKVLLARTDEQQFIPAAYNLATLASLRPQRRILSPIGFRILSWLLLLLGVANVICGIVSLSVSYNLTGTYDSMSYRDGSAIWSGLIAFASGIFYLRLLRIAQMVPKRTMRIAKLVAILNLTTSLIALICPIIWWIVSRDSVNSGLSGAAMVIAMLMGFTGNLIHRMLGRSEKAYLRAKADVVNKLVDVVLVLETRVTEMTTEKEEMRKVQQTASPEEQLRAAENQSEMGKRLTNCYPLLVSRFSPLMPHMLVKFRLKNLLTEAEHQELSGKKVSQTELTIQLLDKIALKEDFVAPLKQILRENGMADVDNQITKILSRPASDQEYEKSSAQTTQMRAFDNCYKLLANPLEAHITSFVVPQAQICGLLSQSEAQLVKSQGSPHSQIRMFLDLIRQKPNFFDRLCEILDDLGVDGIVKTIKQTMRDGIDAINGRTPDTVSAPPKLNFDTTAENEKKKIRAAFKSCYQFIVESLQGQLKDLLLPQFANVKLISSNELGLLDRQIGTKQVSTFLDLIVVRDGFLGPFLQVLDDNSQTSVANVVRKAMGLKPKQTITNGIEEEVLDLETDPVERKEREKFTKITNEREQRDASQLSKEEKKAKTKDLEREAQIRKKFEAIQHELVPELSTHIDLIVDHMYSQQVIKMDERDTIAIIESPLARSLQLLDYGKHKRNFITVLLAILDDDDLGLSVAADKIKLQIGVPLEVKGQVKEDLNKSPAEKHFERCYPLAIELFGYNVKSTLIPLLTQAGLLMDFEVAQLIQQETLSRLVVETLIQIRGKPNFFEKYLKLLKELRLESSRTLTNRLINKGLEVGPAKPGLMDFPATPTRLSLIQKFRTSLPLLSEVFSQRSNDFVKEFFEIGLLRKTEAILVQKAPMEPLERLKAILELSSLKEKFVAPLLQILQRDHMPFVANSLRKSVGFAYEPLPEIHILLEPDLHDDSTVADKREVRMWRSYQKSQKRSSYNASKAMGDEDNKEELLQANLLWIYDKITHKIHKIIDRMGERQLIINGYVRKLIGTVESPQAKSIWILSHLQPHQVVQFINILNVTGLKDVAEELRLRLNLSSEDEHRQRLKFATFYPTLVEILKLSLDRIVAECVQTDLLSRDEQNDIVALKLLGLNGQMVKLLDIVCLKPNFLQSFTEVLTNCHFESVASELKAAMIQMTSKPQPSLSGCYGLLQEVLQPTITVVIPLAQQVGIIDSTEAKVLLKYKNPMEVISSLFILMRAKQNHLEMFCGILTEMQMLATVEEIHKIMAAGDGLKLNSAEKRLKFNSKRPQDRINVLRAFRLAQPLMSECLAGQLHFRFRQFRTVGIITKEEIAKLEKFPVGGRAQIDEFFTFVTSRECFLAPLLRVLDKTRLPHTANFTRRTLGLSQKQPGNSNSIDPAEAEMLERYFRALRSAKPSDNRRRSVRNEPLTAKL